MNIRIIGPLCITLALAACAAAPKNIEATPVIGRPFIDLECAALAAKRLELSDLLEKAKYDQENLRGAQVFGAIALGVAGAAAATAMGPGNQEVNIATLRGGIIAVDQEAVVKACVGKPFGQPEPKPPIKPTVTRQ